MSKIVLVVAAHPDDEALGCGGTIAKLTAKGSQVHLAFLADGESSRSGAEAPNANMLEQRQSAARKAATVLGAKTVHFGGFPDNKMDSLPLLSVVQEVETIVKRLQPEMIITHHPGDLNVDHRITHAAVATACRPQKGHPVRTILCFETPSSTEWSLPGTHPAFEPNWIVDISSTLATKLAALQEYASEMRAWPHPRSLQAIEHLARWRGATMGVGAAEAFVLHRHIS